MTKDSLLRSIGRRLRGHSPWRPRARQLSPGLFVADDVPPLAVDDRSGRADAFIAGLRETLEGHPDGWSGVESEDLGAAVSSIVWYHTIELPGGIVTQGTYDQRVLVPHYGIPDDLSGRSALDVGTWDGFWAFEFERRGARVVAVDLDRMSATDMPGALRDAVHETGLDQRFGAGFALARKALGSSVERVVKTIYDLDPKDLGTFDLVHVGEVLQHVESPTRALRSVRSVTGGMAIISLRFDPDLPSGAVHYLGGWHNATWWAYSLDALAQMIIDAGFRDVRVVSAYRLRSERAGFGQWSAVVHARV